MNVLIWSIENQQYAIDLSKVERIILAVEITPLPKAAEYVTGAINIHGEAVPVIDMRRVLDMPLKDLDVQDHFILCFANNKRIALWVDSVKQVKVYDESALVPANQSFHNNETVQYVLKEENAITLFFDLDLVLPLNTFATL